MLTEITDPETMWPACDEYTALLVAGLTEAECDDIISKDYNIGGAALAVVRWRGKFDARKKSKVNYAWRM